MMNKAPRRPRLTLAQIDNLLSQVDNFNPQLQERVLDLVDNPTQCVVRFDDSILEELTEETIIRTTESVWAYREATEEYLKGADCCCSCEDAMPNSWSILCQSCWNEDEEELFYFLLTDSFYEDVNEWFREPEHGYTPEGFFSIK